MDDRITEADIIDRPDMDDLMTADEWLSEFRSNICCRKPSFDCGCGGYTDEMPSGASRLLREEEEP